MNDLTGPWTPHQLRSVWAAYGRACRLRLWRTADAIRAEILRAGHRVARQREHNQVHTPSQACTSEDEKC